MRSVAAAALLLLLGCGGAAAPRTASSPRRAGPAASAAKPSAAAPVVDPEDALIGMLEKDPGGVLREQIVGPQRTQVMPVPLRIADLPVLRGVGPMLDPKMAPTSLRDVPAPTDLVLHPPAQRSYDWDPSFRPVVVSAVGFTLAELHIGPWVGGTGGDYRKDGGVEVPCGNKDPFGAVVPARWEGLLVSEAGGLKTAQYALVDGWFDRVSCRASSVRRTSTAVKAIVPDLVYGFRSCGSSCSEEESLTLILPTARAIVTSKSDGVPRAAPTGFTRVNLPVRRGSAESMIA